MKIEHFALNVGEPGAIADWYAQNLGLKIVRKMEEAPFMHFLADDSGNTMIEIYNNSAGTVPDYGKMNPLLLHVAFVSENPNSDRQRLEKAGAVFVEEVLPGDGSQLIMMRDPWGLALQLCKRGKPMLKDY
jgi:glyoxylase I family protein